MRRQFKEQPRLVKRVAVNVTGRDFVCGDIHGAYDLVLQAMREAQFSPTHDRLFVVGDLIDRGPGSHRCARFLAQPYVHAVRGNHEDMLLQLYPEDSPPPPDSLLEWAARQNGFGWWLATDGDTRRAIIEAVRRLPIAIEVQTSRGTVGIVHADIPLGLTWQSFLSLVESGDAKTIESALWSRERLNRRDESGVHGVGRLFVGHTPQWGGLQRLGNVYAVDTGGVFAELDTDRWPGARFTFANLSMATASLTSLAHGDGLVEARDGETPNTPFSNYTTSR
ncbi:TPA: metallophosphoesterase [Pseudomonas aeruginosa]